MCPVRHVHRRRGIHPRPILKPAPKDEGHAEDCEGHRNHRQRQTQSDARATQAAGEVGDFAPLRTSSLPSCSDRAHRSSLTRSCSAVRVVRLVWRGRPRPRGLYLKICYVRLAPTSPFCNTKSRQGRGTRYFSSHSITRPGVHGAPAASMARSRFARSVSIKFLSLEDCIASSCEAIA